MEARWIAVGSLATQDTGGPVDRAARGAPDGAVSDVDASIPAPVASVVDGSRPSVGPAPRALPPRTE